jgi:hypothetical protein
MRFKRGAYTIVREHFEPSRNTAIGQEVMIMKPILKVIVKPQISIIRTAAVDIGTRDDKSAKFRAGITVIAIKKIGADFHVQILDDIPDRPGLSD